MKHICWFESGNLVVDKFAAFIGIAAIKLSTFVFQYNSKCSVSTLKLLFLTNELFS